MQTFYSGGLRPYTGLDHPRLSGDALIEAKRIEDDCRAALGRITPIDVDADFEDCWEDRCRLSAAWRASGGDLEIHSGAWNAEQLAHRLGPVWREEEGGHHSLDKLIAHPLVRDNCGRSLTLTTLPELGEPMDARHPSTLSEIARLARAGFSHAVVKSVERKGGVWMVPASKAESENSDALFAALDWAAVRLAGMSGALLVQPAIDMSFEYRLFVVDGELVSAAGCVEEFTPLDRRPGERFDTRVRERRGHLYPGGPSPLVDRPDLVHRYLLFGAELAAVHGGTVVIDVAVNAGSGETIVVELNDLPNSGLYASDPWLVAERLMAAADRGYGSMLSR